MPRDVASAHCWCVPTCRDEIAGCSEQAYLSLPVKDAAKLMMFKSDLELLDYASDVRSRHLSFQKPAILCTGHLTASAIRDGSCRGHACWIWGSGGYTWQDNFRGCACQMHAVDCPACLACILLAYLCMRLAV